MCHDFLPKPGDLMWTPADWAWIGGLINALFAAWYHGVPIVGHRARKFEPQAAMQMMADLRHPQRVPAADRAEADAAGRRQASRRQAAQHLHRRRIARRRIARTGCARPSASTPMKCSARPNAISWSAATQNCFRSGRARWARRRPASTCASSTSSGEELPRGQRGIIGVRQPNPCTMIEYWRNPEAHREEICRRISADRRSRRAG